MDRDDLIAFLKESLRIEVETTSEYTGDMDGSGRLYSDSHTINLVLDGDVISSISL